jgi:hypothetical protein
MVLSIVHVVFQTGAGNTLLLKRHQCSSFFFETLNQYNYALSPAFSLLPFSGTVA